MKLIIAVVNKLDGEILSGELSSRKIGATKLKSVGGFLRQGNTTFLIGVEDQRLNQTLALIRRICGTRTESSLPRIPDDLISPDLMELSTEVVSGGATIWVVSLEEFFKLSPQ